jgi:putative chitinase
MFGKRAALAEEAGALKGAGGAGKRSLGQEVLKGKNPYTESELKTLADKGFKLRGNGFVNKAGKFVSVAETEAALGARATSVLSKAPGVMSKLGGVGKFVGRFGGPLAGLVSGVEAYHESGSLAQAGGAAAGGWAGMEAGAAGGAAIGSFGGPVGTLIGGVVGGVAGSGVGAWAGQKLGSMLDRPHQDASNGNTNVTAPTVTVPAPKYVVAPAPAPTVTVPAPKYVVPPALARHSNPTYKTPVTPGVHVTTSTTLEEIARKQGITDPKELAAFLAQIGAEVGSGASMNENLNYKSADRIHTAFKRISVADAEKLVHNPEALANKAYGGEYGRKNLGNTEEGDGWRYHGRGFIQLTGRANYAAFSQYSGIDILNNPELAARPDIAEQTAVWFWKKNIRPKIKDFSDTAAVTKRVNGGYNGLGERKELDAEYYKELTQYGHILKQHDSKQPIVVVAAPVTNNNQTTNNVAVGKGGSTPRTPTIPSVDADVPTLKSVFGPYV